jgi:hypothetical protein
MDSVNGNNATVRADLQGRRPPGRSAPPRCTVSTVNSENPPVEAIACRCVEPEQNHQWQEEIEPAIGCEA